ncbi:hypothetical protein IWW50_000569 [Coemansia erecta]|nr:hypothetical protein IWW50_000569 [Coemansia erecta]
MRVLFGLTIVAAASVVAGSPDSKVTVEKRQGYNGMPAVEGMDARYQNPFAAFWNQGVVPGQGFAQVGMSAYGYGLPGLGLQRFLNPDALILAGAGEGEISGNDLNHMDNQAYGYGRFKDNDGQKNKGDPAYPGCFKSENCDPNGNAVGVDDDGYEGHRHHYYHNLGVSAADGIPNLATLVAAAAVLGVFTA